MYFSRTDLHDVLQSRFGFAAFRAGQCEAIQALFEQRFFSWTTMSVLAIRSGRRLASCAMRDGSRARSWLQRSRGCNGGSGPRGWYELDLSDFRDHSELFLGVRVGADPEMTPRLPLGTTPFAAFAQHAGSADRADEASHATSAAVAGDLACSGCIDSTHVGSDALTAFNLASNSVGSSELAVNYAGSGTKGGPATSANNLSCSSCVSSSEVTFNYAASTSKAGAASNLSCSNCVSSSEVGLNHAASTSKAGAASNLSCTDCVSNNELDLTVTVYHAAQGNGVTATGKMFCALSRAWFGNPGIVYGCAIDRNGTTWTLETEPGELCEMIRF